ncbi:MAG TPA: polysaccharide deacetylase family protein [Candidatus Limnocylindria bacterium]|nr:polysaccharide deacetylase family protein [Candidatus Limnocylindria bacterium]
MQPPDRPRRRLAALAAVILLLGPPLLLVPAPAARAAPPTASHPRPLVLEAGPQVGFRFGVNGAITGRKRITLSGTAHELAVGRTAISGRGIHLRVGSGPLSGFYVPESIVAYVEGMVGSVRYDPPVETLLPPGTVVAYRFDGAWQLTSAVVRTIGIGYRRPADRVAVINGRRYYRLVGTPWDGSWVPAAGGGKAQQLACGSGPRAPVGSRQVVRRIPNAGQRLALTFDMGGRLDPAMSIMRYLLLNGVCTTIFPTGAAAGTPTGRAVLEMVSQYPELFEVGDHTMNHCDLVRGGGAAACPSTRPTDERLRRELLDAAAVIEPLAGQSPVPYWRPPFGSYDTAVLIAAASVSYTKTILWDIDTVDWRPVSQGGPTAAQIAAKIVSGAQGGSVVLNHLGGYRTRSALPAVIFGLRHTRGMEPTSISDLLARQ